LKDRLNQREILAEVKRLAVAYYAVAGKPLGVTGEIAEFEAADKLGLTLCSARTAGYDAIRESNGRTEKVQIKGRRQDRLYKGRVPSIDLDKPFDVVLLVLLDANYDLLEIWEAPRGVIVERLTAPGSKARNVRRSMSVRQFLSIAVRAWPNESR